MVLELSPGLGIVDGRAKLVLIPFPGAIVERTMTTMPKRPDTAVALGMQLAAEKLVPVPVDVASAVDMLVGSSASLETDADSNLYSKLLRYELEKDDRGRLWRHSNWKFYSRKTEQRESMVLAMHWY